MPGSLGDEEIEAGSKSSTQLLDLSRDALTRVFQALDLESLLTLARTSKLMNQATQHELFWMELCRPWENLVPLESWRSRVASGKALFRLLRSSSRLIGAWVHAHIPSSPRGSLIYITWGPDGLEGWQVSQLVRDEGEITFLKVFDIQGNPDGSHRLEFIFKDEAVETTDGKPAQGGKPSLESEIQSHEDGSQNGLYEFEVVDAGEESSDEDPSGEADTEPAFVLDPSLQRDIQLPDAICGFDHLDIVEGSADEDPSGEADTEPAFVLDPSLQRDIQLPGVICGFDYLVRRDRRRVIRGPAHVVYPSLQSPDELLLGTQGGTEMRGADSGGVYKRLKVAVPTSEQDLAGLWTGCYHVHGWEILNLTYTNDGSIVGTKVTGDPNVPSGVTSFKANLSTPSEHVFEVTEIPGDENDVAEWTRYPGKGRIADVVFKNPNWVDGVLSVGRNSNIRFDWKVYGIIAYEPISLEAAFKKWSEKRRLRYAEAP